MRFMPVWNMNHCRKLLDTVKMYTHSPLNWRPRKHSTPFFQYKDHILLPPTSFIHWRTCQQDKYIYLWCWAPSSSIGILHCVAIQSLPYLLCEVHLTCRPLSDYNGVCLLEKQEEGWHCGVWPLLQEESLPWRIHHICRTGGMYKIPRQLQILNSR